MNRIIPSCLLGFAVIVSGCSTNFEFSVGGTSLEEAAQALIEDALAKQLGLELTAVCPTVTDPDVGTEFSCTATTPSGETVEFEGEVDREDHINIESTNVVAADALPDLQRLGAGLIEDNEGVPVRLDCGTEPIILDENNEMRCAAMDPNGNTATAVFVIDDTRTGDFFVRIEQ